MLLPLKPDAMKRRLTLKQKSDEHETNFNLYLCTLNIHHYAKLLQRQVEC